MKNKILNILKNNSETFISGERLSENLSVSRTAIWKHIKVLRAEGYNIESVTNKGYKLISETNEINDVSLNEIMRPYPFIDSSAYFETIDSTNLEAKRRAIDSNEAEWLIVSSEQTRGKGRLGRQWESSGNAGLWMSLLLRPDVQPESASMITLVTASAMCEAIEKCTNLNVGIKWPNDLVVGDKKICGILTEMSAELNHLNYIAIGIGVNIRQTEFSQELENKATSLLLQGENVTNKDLLIAFLKAFSIYYNQFLNADMNQVINHHKKHSVTLNKNVVVSLQNEVRNVVAVDISEDGCLIIKNNSGELETVLSGEVSVRGMNGYV